MASLLVFATSCSDLGFLDFFSHGDPASRVFRTPNTATGVYYDSQAERLATGTYCLVYGEVGSGLDSSTASDIAREFDDVIYPKITAGFGGPSDVDKNGKIILFYLDIRDNYSLTNSYVAGFFSSLNEYSTLTFPNSNGADMIYLDTYPSEPGTEKAYETVAHEFQHLINYNITVLEGSGGSQSTWINEGLSSGAEYVYSGEVNQKRVDDYNRDIRRLSSPEDSLTYGNNFFTWDWEQEDYATVSLFFQWLRIHGSNGAGIYREILNSSFRDYRCVTAAAENRIDTQFADWPTLISTWMIANLLGQDSGYLGYLGEIDAQARLFSSEHYALSCLYPGEGIFSAMPAGDNTPPASGDNIIYYGIYDDGTIDVTAPYTGDYALVFNASSNTNGSEETGYVANIDSPYSGEEVISRSYLSQLSQLTQSAGHSVDAIFNPDGTFRGLGK